MITREKDTIRLCWDNDDLFRAVCAQTAYNARTLADEKGMPLFDRYVLTDDERQFFERHIAQAMNALFQHFRRIVPDSQRIHVEGETCGFAFAARLSQDADLLYSQAELDALEHAATRILCCSILSEWYLSVQAPDLWKTYLGKSTEAAAELSSLLFRFYRPALRKAYSAATCGCPTHDYDIDIDAGTV